MPSVPECVESACPVLDFFFILGGLLALSAKNFATLATWLT